MTTTDPNVFRAWLSNLTAAGGGDYPELALSGLQVRRVWVFFQRDSDQLAVVLIVVGEIRSWTSLPALLSFVAGLDGCALWFRGFPFH